MIGGTSAVDAITRWDIFLVLIVPYLVVHIALRHVIQAEVLITVIVLRSGAIPTVLGLVDCKAAPLTKSHKQDNDQKG